MDESDGAEKFNFLPHEGKIYGWVPAGPYRTINCNRLAGITYPGAYLRDVDGVTVAWVSRNPYHGGTYVVGEYKNATVYREPQYAPGNLQHRKMKGSEWVYNIVAKEEDGKVIEENERQLKVPRGKGGMGQYNIWYGDWELGREFYREFLDFIGWTK